MHKCHMQINGHAARQSNHFKVRVALQNAMLAGKGGGVFEEPGKRNVKHD